MIGPAGFGVTSIDSSGVSVTVSVVVSDVPVGAVAIMLVVPVVVPAVIRPGVLTVAAAVPVVVQVANDVMFCVVVVVRSDSNNVAVAVNWCVAPTAMNGLAGVMAMDCGSVI